MPSDFAGREVVAPALELIARTLSPRVVTFSTVRDDGAIQSSIVHGSDLSVWDLVERVAAEPGRLAVIREPDGAVRDVRLLIRDGERLVACITPWLAPGSSPWSSAQLRLLSALQPLIELAYVSTARVAASIDAQLPASLTERQRQVARLLATGASNHEIARALYVTRNTAKSHARAVLSKLGLASRREMVLRFAPSYAASARETTSGERDPAMRLEGDLAPRQLLGATLEWAAERMGAVIAGCAFLSPRSELVAEAWGSAGTGPRTPEPRLTWRVHRAVLPPSSAGRIVRHFDSTAAGSPVAPLDPSGAYPGDERLGELVAGLAMTNPLLAVLRARGRVAGLLWLCRDLRAPLDQAESARELRAVHPLLEVVRVARRPDSPTRRSAPGDLSDLGLTPRELAVARLALEGEANAAIASRLGIAEATVKRHMTGVLAKAGVRSRTQLIALLGEPGENG